MRTSSMSWCVALALSGTSVAMVAATPSAQAAQSVPPSSTAQLARQVAQQQRLLEKQERQLQQQQQAIANLQAQLAKQHEEAEVAAQTPKAPTTAHAEVKPAFTTRPGISIAVHGFVNTTAFTQSGPFSLGNGQEAEYPLPGSSNDRRLSGFQLNNSKVWMDISGAKLPDGWTAGAHIEGDFFGGYTANAATSFESPAFRLRLAYATLDHPSTGTTVTIGQNWTLLSTVSNKNSPVTMSHFAFPLGSGIGNLGWRYPGVVVFQRLGHPSSPTEPTWYFDAGIYTGTWSGPGSNVVQESGGNVGFRPQVMARLRVEDGDWHAYIAALYSSADLRGVSGNTPDAPAGFGNKISTHVVQVGGVWNPGRFRLTGALHEGRGGLGAVSGIFSQFGDIRDVGGFIQAAYKLTPHVEASLMYSTTRPNREDVVRWIGHGSRGLFDGQQATAGLFWNQGPFGVGVEFMRARDDHQASLTGPVTRTYGNWLGVSSIYHF